MYARLVRDKLGRPLSRIPGAGGVQVGILSPDPWADTTETPLAIICEFSQPVTTDVLREAHKLAWNFSRSPLLITVEPHLIRSWSCCEPPDRDPSKPDVAAEIGELCLSLHGGGISTEAARALSWVSLLSGQTFRDYGTRFPRKTCADATLLDNLKVVRDRLSAARLPYDVIHDLLARLIFIQFLFDRKDSSGNSALSANFLRSMKERGVLRETHEGLASVLTDYSDTYALFRQLNERFNGDLFPGKGDTPEMREGEWAAEMRAVKPEHLSLLAQFVSGRMEIRKGQYSLWPLYSFDVIPLEFISCIYEVFVSPPNDEPDPSAHYTPAHIVDLILDQVLPWDGKEWDLKVLDPACGSGIFLVKAFQRLIHRWRRAHKFRRAPKTDLLRKLLERNLHGVDINGDAVRVASFSLYLAMCDEIDPRHYWRHVRFPRLRGVQLKVSDFFNESEPGIRTLPDRRRYDLVIGNAPWGRNTATALARSWASHHKSDLTYGSIGPLFLLKAAALTAPSGRIGMLQPASLIFNSKDSSVAFRKKLFENYYVDTIINLAALRFGLFEKAIAPACVVYMKPEAHEGRPLHYVCPKPSKGTEDDFRVIVEPYDHSLISPYEAATDPIIWCALMWGGRRDYSLARRLGSNDSLSRYLSGKSIRKRQGIIRGDRTKTQTVIVGRQILNAEEFPPGTVGKLDYSTLPINDDPKTDSRASTDFSAFNLPQLLIKQGWRQDRGRFEAAIVDGEEGEPGVLCSKSYVSVHYTQSMKPMIEWACLVLNSKVATYYLLNSSGRFASYRPEANVDELLAVPLPENRSVDISNVKSLNDIDRHVRQAFALKPSEWTLIEDCFSFALPEYKGAIAGIRSPAAKPLTGLAVQQFCMTFLRVLRAAGRDKNTCATIFENADDSKSAVQLVAIHLNWPDREDVVVEPISSLLLTRRLNEIGKSINAAEGSEGSFLRRRVTRSYVDIRHQNRTIPTVFLVKPRRLRYWTRSIAMQDADAVFADLVNLSRSPRFDGVVNA
jgi:hypothetical protein